LQKLDQQNPQPLWERLEKYGKWGVPEHLLIPIASNPNAVYFESVIDTLKLPASKVACFLYEHTKHWRRKGLALKKLTESDWTLFFQTVAKSPELWQKGADLFEEYLQSENQSFKTVLDAFQSNPISKKELKGEFLKIISENQKEVPPDKLEKVCMGKAMDKYKGYVLAQDVEKELQKQLAGKGGRK